MLRRAVVGRRGPGLIGAAARTAVVAGTATAVSGRVRDRQAARSAPADYPEQYAQPAPQQPQQQSAAQPSGGISDETLAKLERLSQLQQQGVLTEDEFAAQKAKLLGM